MANGQGNRSTEHRSGDLLPGLNGVEACLTLSEQYGDLFWGRKLMEPEKVRAILQRLNEEHIRYAIIGAVALGYYATPRATQDIALLVRREDVPHVQRLFRPYYLWGTAVVMAFDVDGTHLDVLPANLRLKRTALDDAIDVFVHGVPAKVVSVRDLLLLKLLAIPDRSDPIKAMQDRTDVAALLRDNPDKISREDIRYVVSSLRGLVFTREDALKYQKLLHWLNDTLELLGMADRRYHEGESGQANTHP
jgi:predicted nucleotidyltransferase